MYSKLEKKYLYKFNLVATKIESIDSSTIKSTNSSEF